MKTAKERARELAKYFDWDTNSEQAHCIAAAIKEAVRATLDELRELERKQSPECYCPVCVRLRVLAMPESVTLYGGARGGGEGEKPASATHNGNECVYCSGTGTVGKGCYECARVEPVPCSLCGGTGSDKGGGDE